MLSTNVSARQLKFQTLASDLRRGIDAGTWPLGTKLPTERELAESTGYSINTVRRAIDELVRDQLVEVRQGAGMFVVREPRQRRVSESSIGVLLPDTSLYFPKVLQGIEQTLASAETGLMLATYLYDPVRETRAIERFMQSNIDGLLLVPSISNLDLVMQRIDALEKLGVPVVLIERRFDTLGSADPTEFVCSHHQAGAFAGVRHLHRLGHERIALCLREKSWTGRSIRLGFDEAARRFSLKGSLMISAPWDEWDEPRARATLKRLQRNGVTAALVFGDREATILQSVARKVGIRIPEDLAIVSYDDETAELAEVPLTALAPPKHRLGRLAAEVLLNRIREGEESPIHQIFLRPRIVVRDSCGSNGPQEPPPA
ncbi:LacI family DNA-binding transcriptional regulator [Pseudactinotalea sp. Z1732]|uniref:LacI family DNA-binding transcriptional regulator n=1 Tax=Micrococcales TaxID=85006 RepID=UPI003C7E145D